MTIEKAFEEGPEFKQLYEADPTIAKLIDTARELEGVARHASTHAAGVVIAPRAAGRTCCRCSARRRGDPNALPTTQFGMWDVAEIGLLKMDFLGLTNLTILGGPSTSSRRRAASRSMSLTCRTATRRPSQMLERGETFGVFQLESAA